MQLWSKVIKSLILTNNDFVSESCNFHAYGPVVF